MKLYTEEQVREAISMAKDGEYIANDIINRLTPIELPSDVDMKRKIIKDVFAYQYLNGDYEEGFEDGAMWLKEFILNQNK